MHDEITSKLGWTSLFPFILLLVFLASATGWFVKGLYDSNVDLMAVKFRIYDLVLLFIVVPAGIIVYLLARAGHVRLRAILLGLLVYLAFSYGLNIFNAYQNPLFLVYIAIFSLCLFSIFVGFHDVIRQTYEPAESKLLRIASGALFLIGISGYRFWLADAIVALVNSQESSSIKGMNLPVNAAQVFDIGFILPLTVYGAIRLWQYRVDGVVVAMMLSVFYLLIGISVISMEIGLSFNGVAMDAGKLYGFGSAVGLSLVILGMLFTSRSLPADRA